MIDAVVIAMYTIMKNMNVSTFKYIEKKIQNHAINGKNEVNS